MKTLLKILLCALLFCIELHAENSEYEVVRLDDGVLIATTATFQQAQEMLSDDIGIYFQDKLIAMDSGVAVMKHDNCEVNITTVHHLTDETGYINGCYGNDALYIRTNATGKWVLVQMAGALLWVKTEDVTLIPYHDDLQLSSYFVQEGRLVHQIRTRWSSSEYGSLVDLGHAPEKLSENQLYFSYDCHYFYTDFEKMHKDVLAGRHEHAVNDTPYFNYFMMLPHRTLSSYASDDFEQLLDQLMMNKTPDHYIDENKDSVNDVLSFSQFSGSMDAFFYAQAEYGSNALLMLSLATNESASGNSSLAYRRNNLFGHAAYDSDVEGNARRYLSVSNSIVSHAKNYISNAYANPEKFMYHGSFFGDKNSGMGVSYASDPYWSEKAAQYAYALDEMLGQCDLNRYALALISDHDKIILYDEHKNALDVIENIPLMSFVILENVGQYYRIQLDQNRFKLNSQSGSYDFELNTALIKKEIVDIIINPEQISSSDVEIVTFDAKEGQFQDGSNRKILQFEHSDVVCETPVMKNAVFLKWNQISDNTFEAVYRGISSIEMVSLPDQITELNVPLSLSDGSIKVIYDDGIAEVIDLTPSMVSGYDLSLPGDQVVTVTYGGATTSYPLYVSEHLDLVRTEIFERIDALMNSEEVNEQALNELKTLMHTEFVPVLTMNQITRLDDMYRQIHKDDFSTFITNNDLSLQVSGLYLSMEELDSSRMFGHVVQILAEETKVDSLLIETAKAQGWTVHQEFDIDIKVDGNEAEFEGPLIFSIVRPDLQYRKWAVLTLSGDDVVMCHTSSYQTRVRFKGTGPNQYVLVSKASVNESNHADVMETVTIQDNNVLPLVLPKVVFCSLVSVLICSCAALIIILIKMNQKKSVH